LIGSAYVENKIQWANKFRSVVALRGDDDKFVVTSLAYPSDIVTLPDGTTSRVNAANSGSASKFLPSPKASLIFGPWANTEFYLQGGFGFHSNDGRGATQQVEPVSPDNPYHDTLNTKITPLVQTKGGEIGVRSVAVPHPNCCKMATPEARLLQNSLATAMASNGRITTRQRSI